MLQYYVEYDAITLYCKKEKNNPRKKKSEIKLLHLKSSEPQKVSFWRDVPVFAHCFYFANRHDSTQCYLQALLEQGWWEDNSPMSPAERTAEQKSCTELSERHGEEVL